MACLHTCNRRWQLALVANHDQALRALHEFARSGSGFMARSGSGFGVHGLKLGLVCRYDLQVLPQGS